jgi:hypothetical protein
MGGQQNSEIVAGAPPGRQVEDFSWIFLERAAIWRSAPLPWRCSFINGY